MAVPAHDERDFAFAQKFGLPIRQVVAPRGRRDRTRWHAAYVAHTRRRGAGQLRRFGGMPAPEGGRAIVAKLAQERQGRVGRHLPPARLAGQPPARLGHADPGRLLRGGSVVRHRARARRPAAGAAARRLRVPAGAGQSPLETHEAWLHTTCPKCGGPAGARPTRWTPSWTRRGIGGATCRSDKDDGPIDRALRRGWCPVDSTPAAPSTPCCT